MTFYNAGPRPLTQQLVDSEGKVVESTAQRSPLHDLEGQKRARDMYYYGWCTAEEYAEREKADEDAGDENWIPERLKK